MRTSCVVGLLLLVGWANCETASTNVGAGSGCQTGSKKFQVQTANPMNWFSSYMFCQAQGQRLATILSKEDNDNFTAAITITGVSEVALGNLDHEFWVAATDLANRSFWYWMTTGEPVVGFTQWLNGKPENNVYKDNHCLMYYKSKDKWKVGDSSCYSVKYFACEYCG